MSEMPPQDQLSQVIDDLDWLRKHGAMTGVAEIIRERRRQIEKDWTPEHDRAAHGDGGLAVSVTLEAAAVVDDRNEGLAGPADDEHSLRRAGALAAAEIDRLAAEFGPEPEPAGYRCWRAPNYTHHVHRLDQPCPLGEL